MTEAKTGVVVMAYGTPASFEDVEEFYKDVRRGRPPTAELLSELEGRYAAVGGTSSLTARTTEQVEGIGAELERRRPGRYTCRYGAKHASPKIEQAVREIARLGARELVGLVLAPHYSRASVGEYLERAKAAADELGLRSGFVESWHKEPELVAVLAERVEDAYVRLGEEPSSTEVELLVTAHALPLRVLAGDGYEDRLFETAKLVAEASGARRFRVCWQSAGRTGDEWIGPDVNEVVAGLASEGTRKVVVCPAGFTSDHLEVNYDIDIDLKRRAAPLGVAIERTASLNADPRLVSLLARLVEKAAAGLDA